MSASWILLTSKPHQSRLPVASYHKPTLGKGLPRYIPLKMTQKLVWCLTLASEEKGEVNPPFSWPTSGL